MAKVYYLHPTRMRTEYQSPISAMNMTPLIDVLLVLLVMLILTVPLAVHKVPVDLPVAGTPTKHDPVTQKLVLTSDGVAHWNGAAMNDNALAAQLRGAAISGDSLQFQTEGNARYERFDQLIALAKTSGVTKIGFVGNEQFGTWGK